MITDYVEAVCILDEKNYGTIATVDGEKFTGTLFDLQDSNNDPDGIGYISLMVDGRVIDIYRNQFAGLVEE